MSYIIHFADARYLQDDNVYVVQVYVIAGELKTTNALKCYMDSTRRDRRIPAFYSWPALQRSLARGVSPARRYKAYLAQCDETVCSELRPAKDTRLTDIFSPLRSCYRGEFAELSRDDTYSDVPPLLESAFVTL